LDTPSYINTYVHILISHKQCQAMSIYIYMYIYIYIYEYDDHKQIMSSSETLATHQ